MLPLIQKMLCLDPSRRITARSALEHEYFKDIGFVPWLSFAIWSRVLYIGVCGWFCSSFRVWVVRDPSCSHVAVSLKPWTDQVELILAASDFLIHTLLLADPICLKYTLVVYLLLLNWIFQFFPSPLWFWLHGKHIISNVFVFWYRTVLFFLRTSLLARLFVLSCDGRTLLQFFLHQMS